MPGVSRTAILLGFVNAFNPGPYTVATGTGAARATRSPHATPKSPVPSGSNNNSSIALFMSSRDLIDPWGLQYAVPMQASPTIPPGFVSHPGLATLIEGGLLEPSPLNRAAGFEIFFTAACAPADGCSANTTGIFLMTTHNFSTYSSPLRVGQVPLYAEKTGSCAAVPCPCTVKSMARSESGQRYSLLTICLDAGVRALTCDGQPTLDCFSPTGASTNPSVAFYDHDDQNLFSVGEGFVNFQITFQNQPSPLKYCDNVGVARCPSGYRRVVTFRSSADGRNWSNDAACPNERWYPGGDYNPFDPQFRECPSWVLESMLLPDRNDPPELEFYKFYAFRVGDSGRTAAVALLYAPAPQASLGPNYGMQRAGSKGPGNNSGACGTGDALTHCHGPHIGVELMVGPRVGPDVVATPLNATWARPFRLFASHRRGLVAARSSTCPLCSVNELFTRGPVSLNGSHVWITTSKQPGVGSFLLEVPLYRVAGMYAPANAEFTTPVLIVPPGGGIWLNADVRWTPSAPGAPDRAVFSRCDQGCAGYVMIEVRDPQTAAVVAGFEKERCVLMDVDGSMLSLLWNGLRPPPGAYQLRVYYRDAVVYAIGVTDV